MKRKTKQTSAPNTHGNPVITKESANAHFLKTAKKSRDSGENDYAEKFLQIMQAVQAKPSYTVNDVYQFAAPFNLPPNEIKELFSRWLDTMVMCKKCEIVHGCYDTPVVVTISV